MALRSLRRLNDKPNFEEMLLQRGLVDETALAQAQSLAETQKIDLGEYLVNEGICSESQIGQLYAEIHDLRYVDLQSINFESLQDSITFKKVLGEFHELVVSESPSLVVIAVTHPAKLALLEDVQTILNKKVQFCFCGYKARQKFANVQEEKKAEAAEAPDGLVGFEMGVQISSDVEDIVDRILKACVRAKASDIHIEPEEKYTRVRSRVDGVMQEMERFDCELHPKIVSRLKVLAGIDIAEKRKAQDGSFSYVAEEKKVDLRLSTLPTMNGEKAVIRIIDKSVLKVSLEELGATAEQFNDLVKILKNPFGLVLVTGPTGSGKSTTVYSMLNEVNSIECNIITVEDPVELQLELINQVQVNKKAGLNFAGVLKSILRQDPDIIMIGEVRDVETAEMAARSAVTGHLVISTLHTNSAIDAISRLMDMGIEPYLLSSSLIGVVGQRLVRKLCDNCKLEIEVDEDTAKAYGEELLEVGSSMCLPGGCDECNQTGYRGRTPLFEVFTVDNEVRRGISLEKSTAELMNSAIENGYKSMRAHGLLKVKEGVTSLEEILKATV